jgi:hypothetical protein
VKYIVEPKSRGFDVVDTTAVPRADGFWCYCVDIERAQVIAKLLNDRDGVELLNRHAKELNAEGEDSASFQRLPDLENGLAAPVRLGGISSEQLNVSGDFHEPLEDDDLLAP